MIVDINNTDVVRLASRYLPRLRRVKVYWLPWWTGICPEYGQWGPVMACTLVFEHACFISSRATLELLMSEGLPTLVHELIHCAHGPREERAEVLAYDITPAVLYAMKHNLPEFDALKLLRLRLADVNEAVRRAVGLGDVWELFRTVGVIPWCMEPVATPGGIQFRVKELPEEDLVTCAVGDILAALWEEEWWAARILEELVKLMRLKDC